MDGRMRQSLMKMLVLLVFGTWAGPLRADKKVVILSGSGGQDEFVQKFSEQAETLRNLLVSRFRFSDSDIFMLMEAKADSQGAYAANDARSIRRTFQALKKTLQRRDALFVFLIGHGTFDGEWAKLNIAGKDLRDIDFANLVDQLPTKSILFVNMASASGPFLEKLSREGRVVITATRNGVERNATRFAVHFLSALEQDGEADLNKDGDLSVSEAFIYARDNLIRDYDEKKQLRPEHPLLDDNGDGEGTETPDLLSGDGVLASRFILKQERGGSDTAASRRSAGKGMPQSAAQRRLLAKVRALQAKKDEMQEEAYYKEFEKLMLELARLKQRKK